MGQEDVSWGTREEHEEEDRAKEWREERKEGGDGEGRTRQTRTVPVLWREMNKADSPLVGGDPLQSSWDWLRVSPQFHSLFCHSTLAGLGSDCTTPSRCSQQRPFGALQEDKLSPERSWLFVSRSSSVTTLTWVFWAHDDQEDHDLPEWKQASYGPCSSGKSSWVMIALPQPLMLGEFEEINFEASEV